jgi:hypothetical protein
MHIQSLLSQNNQSMKRLKPVILLLFIFAVSSLRAQSTKDVSIQLSAVVNGTDIVLSWEPVASATKFTVYRKDKEGTNWGMIADNLAGNSTTYTDATALEGKDYDYYVLKSAGSNINRGHGYTSSGINVPERHSRGGVLLVVDSAALVEVGSTMDTMYRDLIGDGYRVTTLESNSTTTVASLKAEIKSWYNSNTNENLTVYLFGNIPVPYSGNFTSVVIPADAHVPDHNGCWATDAFYADMDGNWTDVATNTGATRAANKNNPGDGKYDQSRIPTQRTELMVGRVDLSDLPTFAESEFDMLKQYIRKSHSFKHRNVVVAPRAVINDRLGWFNGEGPGRPGWMNFPGLVGADSVSTTSTYFADLETTDYLFTQVTSTAGYTSISGVGSVNEFKDSVMGTFNLYFGSYFGDWDISNNFLRGCLASKSHTLTSVWSGRPGWYIHHMGMGESIGYSCRTTQSNSGLYAQVFNLYNYIHLSLIGDPTLRMHTMNPVTNLTALAQNSNKEVALTWTASADQDVLGYYIYRAGGLMDEFELLNTDENATASFTDVTPLKGKNVYMIRPVKLEESSSGSYYNLGQGVFVEIDGIDGVKFPVSLDDKFATGLKVYPNPSEGLFNISSVSNADHTVHVRDAIGKIVASDQFQGMNHILNLNNLSKGIYTLEVQSQGRTAVERLIIQ